MHYDRTIIAYHGCDHSVATRLFRGARFTESQNDYDWLGRGIYFWEFGADRALQFAHDQQRRGRVQRPAVVGAVLQLGNCFDLMDTRFTADLAQAGAEYLSLSRRANQPIATNAGGRDRLLRRRDCAVLNWYLSAARSQGERPFDTVRCGFVEGGPVFQGSAIREQSHVQIAVRNPGCVIGVFRPKLSAQ